jgi:hypothetical protein
MNYYKDGLLNGFECEYCAKDNECEYCHGTGILNAWGFFDSHVIDHEFILNSKKELIGYKLTLCAGGPNIYLESSFSNILRLSGFWYDERRTDSVEMPIDLDEAIETIFNG